MRLLVILLCSVMFFLSSSAFSDVGFSFGGEYARIFDNSSKDRNLQGNSYAAFASINFDNHLIDIKHFDERSDINDMDFERQHTKLKYGYVVGALGKYTYISLGAYRSRYNFLGTEELELYGGSFGFGSTYYLYSDIWFLTGNFDFEYPFSDVSNDKRSYDVTGEIALGFVFGDKRHIAVKAGYRGRTINNYSNRFIDNDSFSDVFISTQISLF